MLPHSPDGKNEDVHIRTRTGGVDVSSLGSCSELQPSGTPAGDVLMLASNQQRKTLLLNPEPSGTKLP